MPTTITSRVTNEEWGKIYARAWRDAEFRKRLESEPKAAIMEELGKTISDPKKLAQRMKWLRKGIADHHQHPPSCC